ncbi:unnamed protein product [Peniophora sp. CBMAI 1063]|nr:unnamed protein product [Peniophora sp. CBMAI 1063]
MDTEQKLQTAKENKAKADEAFKAGDVKNALMSYHMALMYLQGINKQDVSGAMAANNPAPAEGGEPVKPKTEVDELLEKIYANQAACHIKNSNWQRALETSDKALSKNETNYKAMFRKAKALGELGYVERAQRLLEDIASKSSTDAPAAQAELARLRALDKQREKKTNNRMKGFLGRDKSGKGIGLETDKDYHKPAPGTIASGDDS